MAAYFARVLQSFCISLFFARSLVDGLTFSRSQRLLDKGSELIVAQKQFTNFPVHIQRRPESNPVVSGLEESISNRANLENERNGLTSQTFTQSSFGTSRKILGLPFSRRERLQKRTKEVAREQRWAKSKKGKSNAADSKFGQKSKEGVNRDANVKISLKGQH